VGALDQPGDEGGEADVEDAVGVALVEDRSGGAQGRVVV